MWIEFYVQNAELGHHETTHISMQKKNIFGLMSSIWNNQFFAVTNAWS